MESLFTSQKPRRGRVALMLAGSLIFHGGLVGLATFHHAPEPELHSVPTDIFDEPASGPGVIDNLPQAAPSSTAEPVMPTPEVVRPIVDEAATPPPSDEPDFSKPSPATQRNIAAKPAVSRPRAGNVTRSSGQAANPSGLGDRAAAQGTGTVAAGRAWMMPHPPYPMHSATIHPTGATTVRITTDATGTVSNAVILRSTGNAMLDAHTVSYVRSHWHGPANASRTTEFVYELR